MRSVLKQKLKKDKAEISVISVIFRTLPLVIMQLVCFSIDGTY